MSTVVYDTHSMNMNLEELEKAFDTLPDYPQRTFDFQLCALISEYANSRGVCWPGMGTLAARLHCAKMAVKRGVDRILGFGFFIVKKVKSEGAKWEHNVYTFAKRFLRKTVDTLAQHFNAAKWKTWVEEKLSARQRKKLVHRYYEQADQDLEDAGLRDGLWMARRYVVKHVSETPGEYDAILAEAIGKYGDYEGPLVREIADRPVQPVSELVSRPVENIAPVQDVSEEDTARMFRVFDAHPELVNNPEEAAVMAGVVLPDMKQPVQKPAEREPVDPEPWLEDYDKPIQWEEVKRETSLESLPANTQPTVQPANVQGNMENVPKFLNGEPSALWESQQLLHQIDPTMYPAAY